MVESGNGRVLALLRAYEEGLPGAERYCAFLKTLGHNIEEPARPVLIARRTTPLTPAEQAAFAREANDQVGLALDSAEQAAADRELLDRVLGRAASGQLDAFSETTPATRALINFFFNEELTRQASKVRIEARLRGFLDEAFKIQPGANLFGQALLFQEEIADMNRIGTIVRSHGIERVKLQE